MQWCVTIDCKSIELSKNRFQVQVALIFYFRFFDRMYNLLFSKLLRTIFHYNENELYFRLILQMLSTLLFATNFK